MNATEAITKIKLLLGLDQEVTQQEEVTIELQETVIELSDKKLVDGTVVKVEGEFEEGKQCYVETEEGQIPAPAGKHEMEDGMLITIDESGVITQVEEIEAEVKEEEVVEEIAMEDSEEEKEEAMEEEEKEDFVTEIVTALKPYMDSLEDLKEKVEAMEGKFQAFASAPAQSKIKKVSEDFEANRFERVAKIAKFRK